MCTGPDAPATDLAPGERIDRVVAIAKGSDMKKCSTAWRYLAVMVLAFSASAFAQNALGRIVGSVTDPQGAFVAGATIRVIDTATGVVNTTRTNDEGYFEVLALPIGTYKVSVERPGFNSVMTQEKRLLINESIRFDITLKIGAANETVNVDAQVSGVETVNPTVGESVTSEPIKNLPLNGRNVLSLALLQPGVTDANPEARWGNGYSISGARTDAITYLLDGGLNTNLMNNTVVLNPNPDAVDEFRILTSNYSAEYGRNAGGIISVVTKSGTNRFHGSAFDFARNDAFNANSFFNNYSGLPRDVLKRQQFGGTLGGPISIPRVIEGKDKAFFFVSYQGQRQNQAVSNTQVPTFTPAELTGDFSQSADGGPDPNVANFLAAHPYFVPAGGNPANAIIDPTKIDPVVQNYINLGFIPTSPTGVISSAESSTDNYNELLIKTDFVLSEKDRLSVTLGGHKEKQNLPYGDGSVSVPGFINLDTLNNYFASIGYNRTFSARMLNEFRFSTQRRNLVQDVPSKTLATPQSLGFVINPDASDGPPPVYFDNGLGVGYNPNGPTNFADTTFSYSDTVSWEKGKHTMRFGGNFWTFADNFAYGYLTSGSFYFTSGGGNSSGNSFADFILGNPEYYSQGPHAPNNVRTKATAVFFQDEWRATKNLTLSLGLRYEYNTPKLDTKGRTDSIFPGQQSQRYSTAPVGILFPGDPGAPKGVFFPDKNNVSPRLGFAWDPWGDHKTSIRGGAGVFYDVLSGADAVDQNGGPPFASYVFDPYDNYAFPAGSGAPPRHFADPFGSIGVGDPFPTPPASANVDWAAIGFLPWQITVTDHNQRTPYVYQYNLSVQRELAKNLNFQAAYVGSSSKKLQTVTQGDPMVLGTNNRMLNIGQTNQNYIDFCTNQGYAGTNGAGACPFGNFPQYTDRGFASYNSFQSSLTKQVSNTRLGAAYFTLAYTYGHSIDNTSGKGNRSQSVPYYNNGLFRASSDFDVLQRVSFGGGWDLPFDRAWSTGPKWLLKGWSLYPIFSWRTGFPINVGAQLSGGTDSPGASGAGDVGSEEAIVNRSLLQITHPSLSNGLQYFTPGAFSNGQYQDTDPTQPFYAADCSAEAPMASSGLFPSFDCTVSNPSLRTYGGPRNALRGPGRTNLDFSLAKSTQVFENLRAELRLEAFNVFNHTEFRRVYTNIFSGNFGRARDTYDPRIVQIALRLSF